MRNATLTAPVTLTREFTLYIARSLTVDNIVEGIIDTIFPGMQEASDAHAELRDEITDSYYRDMDLVAGDLIRNYQADQDLREDTAAVVISNTPLTFQTCDLELLKEIYSDADDAKDFNVFVSEGISDDVLMVACDLGIEAYEIDAEGGIKLRVSVESF